MPENARNSPQAQKKTTAERRAARIRQLQARLQKEKALQAEADRKERNGQLISFGLYMEAYLRHLSPQDREGFKRNLKCLDERNRARASAGIDRISAEVAEAQEKAARKSSNASQAGEGSSGGAAADKQ